MTKNIQHAICLQLIMQNNAFVCENFKEGVFEMDVAMLNASGMLSEFEVKISRQDFKADMYKESRMVKKFHLYQQHPREVREIIPNYFYYVCPDKMIAKNEIPIFAGLYYFVNDKLVLIKKAKRIHPVKQNEYKILKRMLRLNTQRKYLGVAMLTYKNRQIKEKNKQHENRG